MDLPPDRREIPSVTEEVQLLFVRHENSIRAFVRALQPSLADADDVMQETFLRFPGRLQPLNREPILWDGRVGLPASKFWRISA